MIIEAITLDSGGSSETENSKILGEVAARGSFPVQVDRAFRETIPRAISARSFSPPDKEAELEDFDFRARVTPIPD